MFRPLRLALARVGRWPRYLAAASCLLLALVSALDDARGSPTAARTVPVVVARHDLAAGRLLRATDLAIARWPPRLAPSGATDNLRAVVSARTAGPIGARAPVTADRLLGAGLTRGLAAGLAAVAVGLDDPHAADLVRPGDRVDVLATIGDPGLGAGFDAAAGTSASGNGSASASGSARNAVTIVASGVRALAVLRGSSDVKTELVVAADRDTMLQITRAEASESFVVAVLSP